MKLCSFAPAEAQIPLYRIKALIVKKLDFLGKRGQLFCYSGVVRKLAVESCTLDASNVLENSRRDGACSSACHLGISNSD